MATVEAGSSRLTDTELGITTDLVEFVDELAKHPETFQGLNTNEFTRRWPTRNPELIAIEQLHAERLLEVVPEMAVLRYKLSKKRFTDGLFWKTYFFLVRNHLGKGFWEKMDEANDIGAAHVVAAESLQNGGPAAAIVNSNGTESGSTSSVTPHTPAHPTESPDITLQTPSLSEPKPLYSGNLDSISVSSQSSTSRLYPDTEFADVTDNEILDPLAGATKEQPPIVVQLRPTFSLHSMNAADIAQSPSTTPPSVAAGSSPTALLAQQTRKMHIAGNGQPLMVDIPSHLPPPIQLSDTESLQSPSSGGAIAPSRKVKWETE